MAHCTFWKVLILHFFLLRLLLTVSFSPLQAPTIPVHRWLRLPVWMRTSGWEMGAGCWVLHLNTFPPLAPPSAGRRPSTRRGRPSSWAPPEPRSPPWPPRSVNVSTTPNPRNRPALPPHVHPEPFSASLLKTPSAGRASILWNGSILYMYKCATWKSTYTIPYKSLGSLTHSCLYFFHISIVNSSKL